MRQLAATASTLLILGGTAIAADLSQPVFKPGPPPPAMQNWSGFYLGLNAGGDSPLHGHGGPQLVPPLSGRLCGSHGDSAVRYVQGSTPCRSAAL